MMIVRVETVGELIDALSKCPGDMKVRRIYDGMVESVYFETRPMSADADGEFIGGDGEKVVCL